MSTPLQAVSLIAHGFGTSSFSSASALKYDVWNAVPRLAQFVFLLTALLAGCGDHAPGPISEHADAGPSADADARSDDGAPQTQDTASFRVLLFSRTVVFRHDSIPDAIAAFNDMHRTLNLCDCRTRGDLHIFTFAQFDFVDSGKCRLSCSQQRKQADGKLAARPCPPTSAAITEPARPVR
jgi:hypothetical protein